MESPRTKGARLLALDWFRFAAVALMVQGHTFYEVLERAVKDAPWYAWHGYVHGFTAPMFYVSSGLAFGVTTLRGLPEQARPSRALGKRLERYATLVLLGYGMQAGEFSLRQLLGGDPVERASLLAVNTLQNLGVTLAIVQGLVVGCARRARITAAVGALLVLVVLAAPYAHRLPDGVLPLGLATYVTPRHGSLFPLFPWSGYVLAGVLLGFSLVREDGRSLRTDAALHLVRIGLPLVVVGKALGLLGVNPFGPHNYWTASPFFFLQRLGVVVLTFAALAFVERIAAVREPGRALRLVQAVAQETLVIYVGHLLLLYGTPWVYPGLRGYFPGTLGLAASSLCFLAVFAATVAFARLWHEGKRRHADAFDTGRRVVTVVLLLVYALR